jgi:predicted hotdog family 3-hydroxylacyl-ACP dehydratase
MIKTAGNLLELIPQRPPMVMIDQVIDCSDDHVTASLLVDKHNVFLSGGYFSAPGLMEVMAQSAAVRNGWLSRSATAGKAESPRIGVIGGIKDFRIYRLPLPGETVVAKIRIEHTFGNASVISGRLQCGEDLLAEGEMKIFVADNSTGS